MIFQYGDYREAYHRFADGLPETYRDQLASVNFVAGLARTFHVTIIAVCETRYDEDLAPGLRGIGIRSEDAGDASLIRALLDGQAPDLMISSSPNRHVLRWAARHGVPTLLSFADMFSTRSFRESVRNIRLRIAMRGGRFPCLANHSLNASCSAATALRYPAHKIVPWDWSRLTVATTAKHAPLSPKPRVFFAGALLESKGVGDCIEAARHLRSTGRDVHFVFAGTGDIPRWQGRATEIGVADLVDFRGMISHDSVRETMRHSDIVVVPSRHEYAEGLPNTIYETLASRTPLIVSDHPAFSGRLEDGISALIFPAGNPRALADRIASLLDTPQLYARLSENAAQAHESLYVGVEWTTLLRLFLDDPEDATGWVRDRSLSGLGLFPLVGAKP